MFAYLRPRNRSSLLLAAIFVLLIAATACSSSPEIIRETVIVERDVERVVTPTPAPTAPADPITWTIALPEDITTSNVWDIVGPAATAYNYAVFIGQYPTLMGLSDQRFDYIPLLAADFPEPVTQEGDFWVTTVKLKDATWSDGVPITAADFVFTVDTALAMELPGNWSALVDSSVVDHAEALDDQTVKVFFKAKPGLATWQFGLAQSVIVAEHYWKPVVDAAKAAGSVEDARASLFAHVPSNEPVAGPFRVVKIEPGAFVQLERNGRYYLKDSQVVEYSDGTYQETNSNGEFTAYGSGTGDVVLDLKRDVQPQSVDFSVFGSQDAAVLALRSGEVDYFYSPQGLSAGLKNQVQSQRGISTATNPQNGYRYLGFNMRREPMNVPEFREAIATLIDKEFLTDRILQGAAIPVYAAVPEGNGFWWNSQVPQTGKGMDREQRLLKAVDLLKSAGFTWEREPTWDADGRKVNAGEGLQHNGKVVEEMEMLVPSAGSDPLRATTGVWIEQWLREAGIPVTANLTGFNVIVPRVYEEQDFDMWILGWDLDIYPSHLAYFFTTAHAGLGDFNAGGYSNPEFDALADEFLAETDLDRAREQAFQLQQYLAEDLPWVMLWSVPIAEAYRSEAFEFAYTESLGGIQRNFQFSHGPLSHTVFD